MRKFNLYDKVKVKSQDDNKLVNGCIVGFATEEIDGCIVDTDKHKLVEPEKHFYLVLEGEVSFNDKESGVNISEYIEDEIELN